LTVKGNTTPRWALGACGIGTRNLALRVVLGACGDKERSALVGISMNSDLESEEETIYSDIVEPPPPCLGPIASMGARQARKP
jgi:hypothetical protein